MKTLYWISAAVTAAAVAVLIARYPQSANFPAPRARTEYQHSLTSANGVVEHVEIPQSLRHPALARGLADIEQGDFASAASAYREAIAANRNNYVAYHGLGSSLMYAGNLTEAETAYRAALALNPKHAPSWCALGAIAATRKDYESAVHFYSEALRIEPDYGLANYGLGSNYYRLRKYQAAIESLSRVPELLPNSPYAAKAARMMDLARKRSSGIKGN